MTDLSTVKFFVTPRHKCSYLPREDAATLFADPRTQINRGTYSMLSELGFRRSGNYLYRPHCKVCSGCVPVRIPVELYKPSRRHKRVLRKNDDLEIKAVSAAFSEEHYHLYSQYITAKHRDGDMYPPTREQYESFLLSDWGDTTFYEFRENKKLLAVAVCDLMVNGISAVYTFYDPLEAKRSLGVLAILWQIEAAKEAKLASVYLGYWIKQCQKMSYKTEYGPLEMYINNTWRLTPDPLFVPNNNL